MREWSGNVFLMKFGLHLTSCHNANAQYSTGNTQRVSLKCSNSVRSSSLRQSVDAITLTDHVDLCNRVFDDEQNCYESVALMNGIRNSKPRCSATVRKIGQKRKP